MQQLLQLLLLLLRLLPLPLQLLLLLIVIRTLTIILPLILLQLPPRRNVRQSPDTSETEIDTDILNTFWKVTTDHGTPDAEAKAAVTF